MDIRIPNQDEIVHFLELEEETRKQYDKAIQMTNSLDRALDLSGIKFAASSYGKKIEMWLANKYGWETIPQTRNEGDFHCINNKFVELKTSIIKTGGQANYLNLRLDSPVEHYLMISRHMRTATTKIFFVPKVDVQYMVDTFKEGAYNKHTSGHANIRVDTQSIVWEDDPEMNLWSYLHKYEISEDDMINL